LLNITHDEWAAITLSLKISTLSTLCALPIGIYVGFILARRQFWGKSALEALVYMPLILPPVATGYGLLLVFGHEGFVGSFLYNRLGISLFNWTGAALACGIMGFPLMLRSVRLSIESVDLKLEQTASTLGSSPLNVFFTVTLPLAMPGILAGIVLCFAKALGEFGATITFIPQIIGEPQTLAAAISNFIKSANGGNAALRLTIISFILGFLTILISEWLFRRMVFKSASQKHD
jgi:molybdate transport system permease protein